MILFNKFYIQETTNTAGGVSVFGTVNSGADGNQFPSQNDKAYAPGDARIPSVIGIKKKKKKKLAIFRR